MIPNVRAYQKPDIRCEPEKGKGDRAENEDEQKGRTRSRAGAGVPGSNSSDLPSRSALPVASLFRMTVSIPVVKKSSTRENMTSRRLVKNAPDTKRVSQMIAAKAPPTMPGIQSSGIRTRSATASLSSANRHCYRTLGMATISRTCRSKKFAVCAGRITQTVSAPLAVPPTAMTSLSTPIAPWSAAISTHSTATFRPTATIRRSASAIASVRDPPADFWRTGERPFETGECMGTGDDLHPVASAAAGQFLRKTPIPRVL